MLLVLATLLTAQAGSLDLEVEVASNYVWRGANIFGNSQSQQVPMVAPSATYTTGSLWLGYWGAYQLGGSTASVLVDAGVGAEQDVFVGYDLSLSDELDASLVLTAFFYPLSSSAVTGTSVPLWLEPAVVLSGSGPVDWGLTVSWFQGMQSATKGYSFFYLEPTVGTAVPLGDKLELAFGGELGFKGYTGGGGLFDTNSLHVAVHAGLPISLGEAFWVQPALHVAWTNTDQGFGEGLVPWGGVSAGLSL